MFYIYKVKDILFNDILYELISIEIMMWSKIIEIKMVAVQLVASGKGHSDALLAYDAHKI